MTAVELRDVVVGSEGRRRLDGASVVFPPGVTILLGPNGAGKSTLLGTLVGTHDPDAGEVLAGGEPQRGRALARAGLGLVPQRAQLPAGLRVDAVVGYAAWLQRVPRGERAGAVSAALARTNLTGKAARRVGRLSGGEQQRVALACALVHRPPLLLLDEPTVGLDPAERHGFHEALREGIEAGGTVVMATHLLEDVISVATAVAVLVEGRIRFTGSVEAFAAEGGGPGAPLEQAYLAVVGQPARA